MNNLGRVIGGLAIAGSLTFLSCAGLGAVLEKTGHSGSDSVIETPATTATTDPINKILNSPIPIETLPATTPEPLVTEEPEPRSTIKPKPVITEEPEPVITEEPNSASGGFTCKDGTHSSAKHRQGACSHHGGIA